MAPGQLTSFGGRGGIKVVVDPFASVTMVERSYLRGQMASLKSQIQRQGKWSGK